MPRRFTDRIIQHLSHDGERALEADVVAHRLRIDDNERVAFHKAVTLLTEDGRIELDAKGRLRLPTHEDEICGRLFVTQKGHGFVRPDRITRDGDLFLPAGNLGDAMSGDRVRCSVSRKQRGWTPPVRGGASDSGMTGRVVEVIERGRTRFTGTLVQEGKRWIVQPDGKAFRGEPIMVRDPHAKDAKAGDKVTLDLVRFPSEGVYAEGAIVEVLGIAGQPAVETAAVMHTYQLREGFSEKVSSEAALAAISFERESSGPWDRTERLDLTKTLTWTIDPPDARDYDDACSVSFDPTNSTFELMVHIADVSHFVAQGSELDQEAAARGNSTYLPRRVVPMLPETLSNGVCSLQEGVPRFCKTSIMRFDSRGKPLESRFASTVIQSSKRLTYLEAQHLIDGRTEEAKSYARNITEPTDALVANLRLADQLAKILKKRRVAQGQLVLDLPVSVLVFDEAGHVIDAVPEDNAFTHTLIEMFMVEANESVARLFAELSIPLIRRIHPPPAFKTMEELRTFARSVGFRLPDEPEREDLLTLLEKTRGTDSARAVHMAVLKTLSKATYSPALIGHYALASEQYSHFTSPIRRYPDLLVHRALQAWLDLSSNGTNLPGGKKFKEFIHKLEGDTRCLGEVALAEAGRHCSETEVNSEGAERDLRAFLVLQFLKENHLSDELDAVVTNLATQGVWVSINRYLADGLVKFNALPSSRDRADRWLLNERTGRLVSARSGATIGLGDPVKVKILSINLASRSMDLAITQLGRKKDATASKITMQDVPRAEGGRDSRRDLFTRDDVANVKGHKRGFKRGRRSQRP